MAGKRESTASSGAASSKKPKGNNTEDEPFPEEVDQVDGVGDKLGSAVGSHPEGKYTGIEENGSGSDAKSPSDDKLSNNESEYGGDSEEYRPRARFIGDPFSDEEARRLWPHRYVKKKTKKQLTTAKSSNFKDDSKDIILAQCHYQQAEVDGHIFNLYDDAHTRAEVGVASHICKIMEMFEDIAGALRFTAQWFYRPTELTIVRAYKMDKKRIFFSEICDDELLDCLTEKLDIVKLPVNVDLGAKKAAIHSCDYFYDRLYIPEEIWDKLNHDWHPDYLAKSLRFSKNHCSEIGGEGTGSSHPTGDSISNEQHKKHMVELPADNPLPDKLHKHTHMEQNDKQTLIEQQSQSVADFEDAYLDFFSNIDIAPAGPSEGKEIQIDPKDLFISYPDLDAEIASAVFTKLNNLRSLAVMGPDFVSDEYLSVQFCEDIQFICSHGSSKVISAEKKQAINSMLGTFLTIQGDFKSGAHFSWAHLGKKECIERNKKVLAEMKEDGLAKIKEKSSICAEVNRLEAKLQAVKKKEAKLLAYLEEVKSLAQAMRERIGELQQEVLDEEEQFSKEEMKKSDAEKSLNIFFKTIFPELEI